MNMLAGEDIERGDLVVIENGKVYKAKPFKPLGLEDERGETEKADPFCDNCRSWHKPSENCWFSNATPPQPTQSGVEWCEHMNKGLNGIMYYDQGPGRYAYELAVIMFCPICAAPRPKVKELRERVAEALRVQWEKSESGYDMYKMADAALVVINDTYKNDK